MLLFSVLLIIVVKQNIKRGLKGGARMKGLKSIILIIFMIFVLTSCDMFEKNNIYGDHETCDMLMKKLTTYLNNDDYDNAKSLFAPRIYSLDTFESDLNELIEYYDGEATDIRGLVDTGHYSNYDYEEKHHGMEYDVYTENETFRFNLIYIEIDSRSKKNVGIISLYVLKLSEDEYPDERYFGSPGREDGIYVAYPHIIKQAE